MNSRKLHELVISLTFEQQKMFSRFLNSGSSKKSKVKLLFERLRKYSVYSQEVEQKIRGKEFAGSDQYYQARERLLDRLVQCFVQSAEPRIYVLSYVKQAASFSAFNLAEKVWLSECIKAWKNEDIPKLIGLLDLRDDLEYQYNFAFKQPGGAKIPSRAEVKEMYLNESIAREVVRRLRASRKLDAKSRSMVVSTEKQRISNFTPISRKAHFLSLKAKYLVELLGLKTDKAWEAQLDIVQFVQENTFVTFLERLKEYNIFISLSLALNRKDYASEFIAKIGNEKPNSIAEEQQKSIYWIPISTRFAVRFGRVDIARKTIPVLKEKIELFESHQLCWIFYQLALTFWYNNELSSAIKWVNGILSEPKSTRKVFTWQPHVLLLLLHFQNGTFDLIDSLSERAKRSCNEEECIYPLRIIDTILLLTNIQSTREKKAILKHALDEFQELVRDPDEYQAQQFLNFSNWLKAEIQGSHVVDILNSEELPHENLGSVG